MQPKYKQNRHKKTRLKIIVFVLVVIIALSVLLGKDSIMNFVSSNKEPTQIDDARTTSTEPTAQEDFTDGTEREPGNTLREDRGSATIRDNNGVIGDTTDTQNPTVSSTGEIALYTPRPNLTIKPGSKQEISGTSTLSSVSYRLIDSATGVIATGVLHVVNGKFSGVLNFTTQAKEGRLDIFAVKTDGTEFSNIEIPLRF